MGRPPFVGSQEICQYLLRPENAMWHFALKYHHEQAQSGDDWPAYYNGGVNMWGYQQRHESYRQRFAAFLDDYVPAEGTDAVLEAGN
jgi:hypothetical protein